MSYILDALNRADSERERQRSAVPGLHAQSAAGPTGAGRGLWLGVALGVIGVLAVLVAWLWVGRGETAPPVAALAQAASPTAAAPPPMPAPPPVAERPMPAPAPATMPTPAPVIKPPALPPIATLRPPAAAAASAPARTPTRNELPPELRAALPPINISGAVYAPNAAGRLLFVNGQVLREGDALAEGLTVERIGASTSVLVFRGQRFEIKH
jgi:general secretion pathway protein B